jgi:hypothetical protein
MARRREAPATASLQVGRAAEIRWCSALDLRAGG